MLSVGAGSGIGHFEPLWSGKGLDPLVSAAPALGSLQSSRAGDQPKPRLKNNKQHLGFLCPPVFPHVQLSDRNVGFYTRPGPLSSPFLPEFKAAAVV